MICTNVPGDVTVLLQDWSQGNEDALNPLFELMYPQLRYLAAALMRREQPGADLQPTGVANEFYLKLVEQKRLAIEDRVHFLSLAARFMRRILVDQARRKNSIKRQGGKRIQLTDDLRWVAEAEPQLIDLDRALEELRAIDERKCRMIELRYFLGFGPEETAELLGFSKATLNRELRFARAWIQERLGEQAEPDFARSRLPE